MENFYQTRDLVARRAMFYDGADLRPGDRFRPMSQVDADYLVSRQCADLADGATTERTAPQTEPLFWPLTAGAAPDTPPPAPARRVVRRRAPAATPDAALTDDTTSTDTSAPD